jgi:DNA helicase-2/ATP-dependent DNA helicase PcrA
MAEERRLMYVGMTRARERLTLSLARRRMVRGEWTTREPSPFLSALPASSVTREDLSAGSYRLGAGTFRGAASGGGLFPDDEGGSQEPPAAASRRFGGGRAAPARLSPMRRTPAPPSASGFRRGSRVRHPEYGAGVVLSLEGSGDAEKVTVYFERAGKRKFVARYANLSLV